MRTERATPGCHPQLAVRRARQRVPLCVGGRWKATSPRHRLVQTAAAGRSGPPAEGDTRSPQASLQAVGAGQPSIPSIPAGTHRLAHSRGGALGHKVLPAGQGAQVAEGRRLHRLFRLWLHTRQVGQRLSVVAVSLRLVCRVGRCLWGVCGVDRAEAWPPPRP